MCNHSTLFTHQTHAPPYDIFLFTHQTHAPPYDSFLFTHQTHAPPYDIFLFLKRKNYLNDDFLGHFKKHEVDQKTGFRGISNSVKFAGIILKKINVLFYCPFNLVKYRYDFDTFCLHFLSINK